MKTIKYALACLLTCIGVSGGEFVNLGFDDPDLSRAVYDPWKRDTLVPPEDAVRGWTMEWDWIGEPRPLPDLVGTTKGYAPIGLNTGWAPPGYPLGYTLRVDSFWHPPNDLVVRPVLHLYQVGLVPQDATDFSYYCDDPTLPSYTPDLRARLYINGDEAVAASIGHYHTVDVSPFAGQEVRLEFVFPMDPMAYYSMDIKGFTVIPEPSVSVLLAVGGFCFYALCRRK